MPVRKIRSIYSALLIPFFIVSCGDSPKIEEEILVKVYVDLLIVQETYFNDADSMNLKKTEVFKNHDITEEDYLEAINQIGIDAERWEIFFNKAYAYIDSIKVRENVN